MRTSRPRSDGLDDAIDHLVDVEMVGVDHDRIRGWAQWSNGPLAVDAIAVLNLFAHRLFVDTLASALVLSRAPADLLLRARDQKEFVVGVGKDDGSDVAPGHHHARTSHLPLLLDKCLAYPRCGRNDRKGVG